MEKIKLLVSFSGGETSAYMLWWILKNWINIYEIKIVFANTGEENEETLLFVKKCAEYFKCEIIWVEALVNPENKKGTRHVIVNFQTASRNGQPFEDVIKKYGIPNQNAPHCNRELKLAPLRSYLKSIGWKKYYTAIGIRSDEFDRVNSARIKRRLLYPLIENKPMTKPKINQWWNMQPFRLNLKGYEGNCKTCWKKSDNKLYTIINQDKNKFNFFEEMEKKYENYLPESVLKLKHERGEQINFPLRFFRKNRSVEDLVKEAELFTKKITDDASIMDCELDLFDLIEEAEESCDIYSECKN